MKHNPNNIGIKDYFYTRFYRNNITGLVSDKIYDFTDVDELTFNNKYRYRVSGADLQTPFKEITVVPYKEVLPPYWFDLMKVKPRTKKVTLNGFMDGFKNALTKFIDKNWTSDKFHFVLHSSGWDSRILSAVLRELYEKRGREGFGRFVFVCWGAEIPAFRKIMQLKGWSRNDYFLLPQFDDAYYQYFFDFKNACKYLNGSSSYPVNEIYWALDVLKRSGKVTASYEETEFWFAHHFNIVFHELVGQSKNTIKEFLDKHYYDTATNYLSSMPCKVISTIDGLEPMRHIIESDIEKQTGLRHRIAKRLNPELGAIPRVRIPTGQLIPQKHLSQIKQDYDNSWYGKNIRQEMEVPTLLKHNPFWVHWSTASIIDYYISKCVNIEKER